jgi:hypothetical protein
MKLRHASALALVGWYLMVPPRSQTIETQLATPLSQWITLESFDNADTCKSAKRRLSPSAAKMVKRNAKNAGIPINSSHVQFLADSIIQCISSDDPRLNQIKPLTVLN